MSDPLPASTVVLLRDRASAFEVFMVRRHQQIAFMGGAYVFPGGRVDDRDGPEGTAEWICGAEEARARLADLSPREAVAHYVAAVRELFEEAGVLLAWTRRGSLVAFSDLAEQARFAQYRHDVHHGLLTLNELAQREELRLALDALIPFARWVTPRLEGRRFDARFFVAHLPDGQHPLHDERESIESRWLTPREALDLCGRDAIELPPPTWQTLRALEKLRSSEAVVVWARAQRIVRNEPRLHQEGDTRMLLMPGDPLYPAEPGQPAAEETRFIFVNDRWKAQRI